MKYYIDNVKVQNNTMAVLGWAASDSPEVPVQIEVHDQKKKIVKINRTDVGRYDVNQDVFHGMSKLKLGFCVLIDYSPENTYYMIFIADGKKKKEKLIIGDKLKSKKDKILKFKEIFRADTIERGFLFLKKYGLKAFIKKFKRKVKGNKIDYNGWRKQVICSPEQLELQRKKKFPVMPKFSIVVPVYRTPEKFLREMIRSVQAQTYQSWELCIADGSHGSIAGECAKVLSEYQKTDSRIKVTVLPDNMGIAGNTNAALALTRGDYVVLLDHDDVLAEDALYECALRINEEINKGSCADVLYSDEDKLTSKNKKDFYLDPHFKPDFNPDLLRSMNYISHLLVVKKELVDKIGGFRQEFDGAQDYDFIFRCVEQAKKVCHISKVLYHWRVNSQSTAENPEKKMYAFEAGARAIKAHCKRAGLGDVEVKQNEVLGAYRVVYPVKGNPKVSIVIPNKDHTEDLRVCVKSVLDKASYKNVEMVIVENNSTEEKTFACYKELEAKYDNLKIVTWKSEKGFNFSSINNYALPYTTGDYLLFLNNDTEFINEDCIEELLGYCQREDVGIAGAKLFYDDDTIQHAGVVVGYGGIAGHTFIGFHKGEKTYFLRAFCAQDYSAVTAACMMTKRSIFEEVGGFYEGLAVAFNDIDYCMKVRKLGKLVVYNPFAQLYHYESKSRGIEDTPEKVLRFEHEVETFRQRWPEILEKGDPYYNPNLTLLNSDFSLRNFEKEPIEQCM
ncbi:glycosyltransferase [Lacrimispora sp. NSJ-141]|uniref:Glycosyltransferase n=1 Tax=Lientehia hominis TaxID=2897778 RepID=A0AAP2W780_9FIRM|nr:glycosyltransferase [Lientehia hominis]MCD2492133.1 glycosyltransferase [Lientehia hominis]